MIPFVGLTGGIASGKSTVAAHFASLGVSVIDADDIGRALYGPNAKATNQIGREFGTEFIGADAAVDRNVLRRAVFTDSRLRKRLEAITHPLIRKECLLRMNSSTGVYGLMVAPLLFEANFITEVLLRVLVIDCPELDQVERGIARGNFSKAQVLAAIKAQIKRDDRLARADDIIVNNGDLQQLIKEVENWHGRYSDMFVTGHASTP